MKMFLILFFVTVINAEKSFPYAYGIERDAVDPVYAYGRRQRVDEVNDPRSRRLRNALEDFIRTERNLRLHPMIPNAPSRNGYERMPRNFVPPPPPRFRGHFGDLLRDIEERPVMEIDFELPKSGLNDLNDLGRRFIKRLGDVSPNRPAFLFGRRSPVFSGGDALSQTPILDMKNFVTDMTPEAGGIWLRNHTTGVMYTTIPVRGIDPSDIQVKISRGNMLVVSAQRVDNDEKTFDGHGYKVSKEDFHEEFPLPYEINGNVRATIKNQVLKIELPSSSSSSYEDDDFSSQKQQQKARDDEEEDSRSNNSDEDNETLEYEEYESEEQLPFDDAEYKDKLAPSLRAKYYPSDNLPV